MFRVEVVDACIGHCSHPIPALYAGKKPGEGTNTTIPRFANLDCPPDDYIEFLSIIAAQEAADYLKDKGYEAKILTGEFV